MTSVDVRCEWGLEGIAALRETSEVIIIVDVLSFSTCVDIAAARGAQVYPCQWKDKRAMALASSLQAELAMWGDENIHGYALSPSTLLSVPSGARLVLPSPNGSALSLETGNVPTFTGCLRNAATIAHKAQSLGRRISLIPAGERWSKGGLRFALEDLIGAGSIIAHLSGVRSPEAELAVAAYTRFQYVLLETLQGCESGLELIERGRSADLELAAALNVSQCAPYLREGSYSC